MCRWFDPFALELGRERVHSCFMQMQVECVLKIDIYAGICREVMRRLHARPVIFVGGIHHPSMTMGRFDFEQHDTSVTRHVSCVNVYLTHITTIDNDHSINIHSNSTVYSIFTEHTTLTIKHKFQSHRASATALKCMGKGAYSSPYSSSKISHITTQKHRHASMPLSRCLIHACKRDDTT